jgi:CBS domain-containing protein
MAIRKGLDARVAEAKCEIPGHPRVSSPTVRSVLQNRHATLHFVSAEATLLEALRTMEAHGLAAVPVLDDGRLIGIFAEHDFARIWIAASGATSQSAMATPLRQVMTPCEVWASLADPVPQCLSVMMENHLRYLPVREQGKLIALLPREDFLAEMVAYLERVFKENELDQKIVFLQGTYSC